MAEPESFSEPEGEMAAETEPEMEAEIQMAETEPETEPEMWSPESEAEAEQGLWGAAEGESPYYPTVESEPLAEFSGSTAAVWVSLYAICMTFIIIGDTMVVISILRKRCLRRKEANIYLLSLIVARTMIGVFVVPVRISAIYSEEYLGSVLCKLCHWSAQGSLTTSVISMLAVAITKYNSTMNRNRNMKSDVKPIPNAFAFKKIPDKSEPTTEVEPRMRNYMLKVAGIWILGHVYSIRVPFLFDLLQVERDGQVTWSCRVNMEHDVANKSVVVLDFVCLFMLPLLIVLYCYVRVLNHTTLITVRHSSKLDEGADEKTDNKPQVNEKNADNFQSQEKSTGTLNHMTPATSLQEEKGDDLFMASTQEKLHHTKGDKSSTEPTPGTSYLEKSIREEKKTSLMLIIVMILFLVCNTPPNAIKIYRLINGATGALITNTTEQVVYLTSYSNSWLNVLVYIFFRDDIRQSLREMMNQCRDCAKMRNKVDPIPKSSSDAGDFSSDIDKDSLDEISLSGDLPDKIKSEGAIR